MCIVILLFKLHASLSFLEQEGGRDIQIGISYFTPLIACFTVFSGTEMGRRQTDLSLLCHSFTSLSHMGLFSMNNFKGLDMLVDVCTGQTQREKNKDLWETV